MILSLGDGKSWALSARSPISGGGRVGEGTTEGVRIGVLGTGPTQGPPRKPSASTTHYSPYPAHQEARETPSQTRHFPSLRDPGDSSLTMKPRGFLERSRSWALRVSL